MLAASKQTCFQFSQPPKVVTRFLSSRFAIESFVGVLALSATSVVTADDIACEVTVSNAGLVDARSFPTVAGDRVLRGRTDGNPATCTIIPNTSPSVVAYPNGLTILSNGTHLDFRNIDINISNGLLVDNSHASSGVVSFTSQIGTRISGDVQFQNASKVNFITHNTASSTTRLHLEDAYFFIDDSSVMGVEYQLGDTTGEYISVGSLSGAGDIQLTNTGHSSSYGTIFLNHNNGQDYLFSGDIFYSDQMAPKLVKSGAGTFTFTGDVNKNSGDTSGFTDGFGFIEVTGGALEVTTEAFIYGTRVELSGGDLIFNQDVDGTALGADLQGNNGTVFKRGSGTVSLNNIGDTFQGLVHIQEGSLAVTGDSEFTLAESIEIDSGSQLDISGAYTGVSLTRLYGSGSLHLGDKDTSQLIRVNPGAKAGGIGVLSITGTGQFGLSGSLVEIEIDASQDTGNAPGVTHDQLSIESQASYNVTPLIKLVDRDMGTNPSNLVDGREFTVLRAGSGLSGLSAGNILEDTQSFHAFVGADAELTTITDTEVTVVFGIKSVNQVVNTIQQVLLTPATVIAQPQPSVTTPPETPDITPPTVTPPTVTPPETPDITSPTLTPPTVTPPETPDITSPTVTPPTVTPPETPDNTVIPVQTGSAQNTGNAATQYIQQTTGLTGTQTPTPEQIETHPALASVTTEGLIMATSNNNPEAYSSHLTIGLEYQDLVGNMVMNHTSGSGLGLQNYQNNAQGNGRSWLDVVYVDGKVGGKAGYTGNFDYTLTSLVTGIDLLKTDSNSLGLFVGIGSSQLKEHDHIIQDIDTDALNIGSYHQFQFASGYKLHSTIMGFYHNTDSSRGNLDTSGSLISHSNADFSSYGASLGVMLNKDFSLSQSITISPDIDVNYSYLQQKAINEYNGGPAYDYFINATDAQSLVLGFGADTSFKLSPNKPIYLDLRARYEFDAYANNNETHDIDAGLNDQNPLTYIGQNRGEHGFILGLALGGEIAENATLSGGYWFSHRSNGRESSLGANFTYYW